MPYRDICLVCMWLYRIFSNVCGKQPLHAVAQVGKGLPCLYQKPIFLGNPICRANNPSGDDGVGV